jgi:nitric oxide reductase subunit B
MKNLWTSFAIVFVLSFAFLGWIGTRIYREMRPIPMRIVSSDGTVVAGDGDVGRGQNVWQALGGMEVGSVWGHGSYVAPDWTADWLHREATFVLNDWSATEGGKPYEQLSPEEQSKPRGRLEAMYRRNNYDAANNQIIIEPMTLQTIRSSSNRCALAHSRRP